MIELAPETEALAHRLADQRNLTVDEVVRDALQERQIAVWRAPAAVPLAEEVAARIAAMERIVAKVAALPDLDPRSTQEIVDELNAL